MKKLIDSTKELLHHVIISCKSSNVTCYEFLELDKGFLAGNVFEYDLNGGNTTVCRC